MISDHVSILHGEVKALPSALAVSGHSCRVTTLTA